MKKHLVPLFVLIILASCNKDIKVNTTGDEAISTATKKPGKILVCHYDATTGKNKTIQVTANAVQAHLAHGDVLGDCSGPVTTICNKDWMVKNLDVSFYKNGDPIPEVSDPAVWERLTTGAWCYINNDPALGQVYGKLYNWYAVNDSRGIAPEGWHVATDEDWTELTNCLGGESVAGGAMKEAGTVHWASPNYGATNSSGFTGLPGSYRHDETGTFEPLGFNGYWWTAFDQNTNNIWYRGLNYQTNATGRSNFGSINFWLSVRCVRD